jgi:hypothetical protein
MGSESSNIGLGLDSAGKCSEPTKPILLDSTYSRAYFHTISLSVSVSMDTDTDRDMDVDVDVDMGRWTQTGTWTWTWTWADPDVFLHFFHYIILSFIILSFIFCRQTCAMLGNEKHGQFAVIILHLDLLPESFCRAGHSRFFRAREREAKKSAKAQRKKKREKSESAERERKKARIRAFLVFADHRTGSPVSGPDMASLGWGGGLESRVREERPNSETKEGICAPGQGFNINSTQYIFI